MWVCLCKSFNDKSVRKVLEDHPDVTRAKDLYKHLSDGERPQCGTCMKHMQGMIDENRSSKTGTATVQHFTPRK